MSRAPAARPRAALGRREKPRARARRSAPTPASLDDLERELQVRLLVARKGDGIDAGVARRAVRRLLRTDRALQPLETQVGEAVGFDELANLLERVVGGNQLGAVRRVDAVEARGDRPRTRNAHVHLLRPGGADHLDDLPAGGAAHDRIVDEDDALAFEHAPDRVQLDAHAEMPDRLLRLDEG